MGILNLLRFDCMVELIAGNRNAFYESSSTYEARGNCAWNGD